MRLAVRSCLRIERPCTDVGRIPADEAVKIGKDAITTLLAPAKDVVALLDLVAQVHPAVQVDPALIGLNPCSNWYERLLLESSRYVARVNLISIHDIWCPKVVVQLELNRLDNDKHIAALYFTMVTSIPRSSSNSF
jgi:hypothetical protein